ncbi:hypothetical protein EJD97_025435 [Solanum chilense]|uniref:Costars domain-containing protein n=1 Tax=Solanum chilense TaxID=4083 RepID=A0A6N2CDP1_SOLCI|nr:hypothetical protein EJD97_025435 [Solanum chilense]
MNVEEEVERLKEEIKRLGTAQDDGSYKVTFGVLFNDDRCANIFEALVGTLRAAKKRKFLTYDVRKASTSFITTKWKDKKKVLWNQQTNQLNKTTTR